MYLFSRIRTMNGARARQAAAYAVETCDFVTNNSGMEVSPWRVVFGQPVGTYAFSAMVESQAEFAEATAKLSSLDEYWQLAEDGAALFSQGTDSFRQILHMTNEPADQPVITAMQATVNSDYAGAIEWSIEILDYTAKLTGAAGAMTLDAYGPFGSITWYGAFDDVAGCQRFDDIVNVDPGYVERLAKAGERDLFVPAGGNKSLALRVN